MTQNRTTGPTDGTRPAEEGSEKKGGWFKDEQKMTGKSHGEGSWTGSAPVRNDSEPGTTDESGAATGQTAKRD